MHNIWKTIAATAFVAAHCASGLGQTMELPVILTIETDNAVFYRGDVTDGTKLARDPGVTTPGPSRAFQYSHGISDIIAVNGKPAKGISHYRGAVLVAKINPQPGQTIADHDGNGPYSHIWQIQSPDGTWIGNLLDGGSFPASYHTITGGAGAFLGVTGEHRLPDIPIMERAASITEDPANRRILGGGKMRTALYLYPKYRPAVDITPTGTAVYHGADFSPVTTASPAHGGEILVVAARNLGPTRPDLLPPGSRPFKADPLEVVNSPLAVTVNGNDAEVINKVGWPGKYDLYRVDFRVPPGLATVQLTVAWIPGPEVKIAVQ